MKKVIFVFIFLMSLAVASFAQIKKKVKVSRKQGIQNIMVNKVIWGTAETYGHLLSYELTTEIKDLKGVKIASAKFNTQTPTEEEIAKCQALSKTSVAYMVFIVSGMPDGETVFPYYSGGKHRPKGIKEWSTYNSAGYFWLQIFGMLPPKTSPTKMEKAFKVLAAAYAAARAARFEHGEQPVV